MSEVVSGYQYEVLDCGDYIYKRLLTQEESAAKYRDFAGKFVPFLNTTKLAENVLNSAATSVQGIRALLDEYPEIGPTLANPVIYDSGDYTQDKVDLFGDALRNTTSRGAKHLLDKYVELSLLHVSYGFMERVFNSTFNSGVDSHYNVVLLDLGKLTFDRNEAVRLAHNFRWTRSEVFLWPFSKPKGLALPNNLKAYYFKRMLSQFSANAVEQTWQQSLRVAA